jgi:hypothetical protein
MRIINHLKSDWFRYGFETIAVVVGILVAFALDNWNEKRIEKQRVHLGLTVLKEAMHEDRVALNVGREMEVFRTHSLQYLLKQAGQMAILFDPSQTIEIPYAATWVWKGPIPEEYDPEFVKLSFTWSARNSFMGINHQVINELESTGIYSQIENKELKRLINTYFHEIEWRFDTSEDRMFVRQWDEYLVKRGIVWLDISNIEDPMDLFKNNPEAVALVYRLIQESRFRAVSAVVLLAQNEAIVQMINAEISD